MLVVRNDGTFPGKEIGDLLVSRGDLGVVHQMLQHPRALAGLSDAGAHVGTVCDASFSTFMLTHWVKQQGLPLEWAVQKLTSLPAEMMGLKDRGVIKQGMKADLNIIDLDRLEICFPYVVSDLPAGACASSGRGRRRSSPPGRLARKSRPCRRSGRPVSTQPTRAVRRAA